MPMQLDDNGATLSGQCGAEEAQDLADWLRDAVRPVRLAEVTYLHTAVLQCLLAFDPPLEQAGTDSFIAAALAGGARG